MKDAQKCSYKGGWRLVNSQFNDAITEAGPFARCPVCNRRVRQYYREHKGKLYIKMPSHKRKGWWKIGKHKKQSRDIRMSK